MANPLGRIRVSYVFDWIIVIALAAAGGVLNYIGGFHRPFTLTEYDISYPLKPDIVSIPVVILVALLAPAVIILVLSLILPPTSVPVLAKSTRWRVVAWDVHAGWLGLATGLAITLFITSGLKDVVGKPRPNLLARCNPDLTAVSKYLAGGFGNSLNSEAEPLVFDGICQERDKHLLDDGFAAFPSGHSSFSSAGLVYLSLWLCARLSVSLPILDRDFFMRADPSEKRRLTVAASQTRAAPPLWQVAFALCPIPVALFISASRYADFHHAGIDICAGIAIGTLFGWASFRLYHLPIRRGRGIIAWGQRTKEQAFFANALVDPTPVMGPAPTHPQEGQFNQGYMMDDLEAGGVRSVRRVYTGSSAEPVLQN